MYERTNNCSSYNLYYIHVYLMDNVTERLLNRGLSFLRSDIYDCHSKGNRKKNCTKRSH